MEDAQDATSFQARPEPPRPIMASPSCVDATFSSSIQLEPPSDSTNLTLPEQPRTPPLPSEAAGSSTNPFDQLLHYYLTHLERKDLHKFFHFPITDMLAPNYSSVVKHPMDFSTMRKKLARGWYESLSQFKVSKLHLRINQSINQWNLLHLLDLLANETDVVHLAGRF